jgi:CubicO group peptidase (beta-lactamase class C family)
MKIPCLVLLAGVLAGSAAAAPPDADSQDFDRYVERARQQFDVPAIAVAVVKDGRVVFERGYGQRQLDPALPADAHTLFSIASNTKSFTATAMEMLADEGKLKLDDRVIDHLPWFQMSDPYVTREMRLRDVLSHRTGLGLHAGDLLYNPVSSYSMREVVERLRTLPLARGFRAGYAYDNIMFAVAALVIEQASGQSYAEFVQNRIFRPLGMNESRINATALLPDDVVAACYFRNESGALQKVAPLAWTNNPGAAGIYASAHDMALWAQAQLAVGQPADGKPRLLSTAAQQDMWSMVTPIPIDPPDTPELAAATPQFLGYGEGWYVSDYRGHKLVWHGGDFPGATSRLTLVPELGLGVVVLTNQESQAARDAVTLRVLDHYFGPAQTDWVGDYARAIRAQEREKRAQERRRDASELMDVRIPSPPPPQLSLPLSAYSGTYRDAWYGDVLVSVDDNRLRISFSKTAQLSGLLLPAEGMDHFIAHWDDRTLNADADARFVVSDGAVSELQLRRASPRTASAYDYQDLHLLRIR